MAEVPGHGDDESDGLPEDRWSYPTREDWEARRPMNCEWISYDLLTKTKRVWSDAYREEVNDEGAIEILNNVKRLGEFLVNQAKEQGVSLRPKPKTKGSPRTTPWPAGARTSDALGPLPVCEERRAGVGLA